MKPQSFQKSFLNLLDNPQAISLYGWREITAVCTKAGRQMALQTEITVANWNNQSLASPLFTHSFHINALHFLLSVINHHHIITQLTEFM